MGSSKKKGIMYQKYMLLNNSSITYKLRWGKAANCVLEPFKPVIVDIRIKEEEIRTPKFTVENMWIIDYKHPVITLEVSK